MTSARAEVWVLGFARPHAGYHWSGAVKLPRRRTLVLLPQAGVTGCRDTLPAYSPLTAFDPPLGRWRSGLPHATVGRSPVATWLWRRSSSSRTRPRWPARLEDTQVVRGGGVCGDQIPQCSALREVVGWTEGAVEVQDAQGCGREGASQDAPLPTGFLALSYQRGTA